MNPSSQTDRLEVKSTVEQIRTRFDADVERFSNLETGQSATIDAPLAMDLLTSAAVASTQGAQSILDIGCGAGNYTLKMLQLCPGANVTVVDLSEPMLERAQERIQASGQAGQIHCIQADVRDLKLPQGSQDIIVAAAVLHHLRAAGEWRAVFAHLFDTLSAGGGLWVFDLVQAENERVQELMWARYGNYLSQFRDEAYRDQVFDYIEQEDSPRSLAFQLDVLERVGFRHAEVLHKVGPFAAFGAIKPEGGLSR
ncbi:MAG: class I SAM-dependent methyltransferase [Gemmatimonadetes bacterium]|nr:class I SAM-dependent methyltransferase [Gemmatimonadota bacterium]MBT6146385.1 class I SAM-dependent methyltransferase [Gemmatimonadota bacterium]